MISFNSVSTDSANALTTYVNSLDSKKSKEVEKKVEVETSGYGSRVWSFIKQHPYKILSVTSVAAVGVLALKLDKHTDQATVGAHCTRLLFNTAGSIIVSSFPLGFNLKISSDVDLGPLGDMDPNQKSSTQDKGFKISDYAEFLVESVKQGTLAKGVDILNREAEIRKLAVTLLKKEKNNAMLTGPAGSGKSAIVIGLAKKIAKGDVPKGLKDFEILSLNLTALRAGTTLHGIIEKRFSIILNYLKEHPKTILFIDEIHMIMDHPLRSQPGDFANVLKPVLAKGLACIGATTEAEYKQLIQADAALDRRFQEIPVEEMTKDDTLKILLASKKARFEAEYEVEISDEVIRLAVDLSARIKGKHFPDKALDLLALSCSAVSMEERTVVKKEDIQKTYDELMKDKALVHLSMYG